MIVLTGHTVRGLPLVSLGLQKVSATVRRYFYLKFPKVTKKVASNLYRTVRSYPAVEVVS